MISSVLGRQQETRGGPAFTLHKLIYQTMELVRQLNIIMCAMQEIGGQLTRVYNLSLPLSLPSELPHPPEQCGGHIWAYLPINWKKQINVLGGTQ
jgi:hypothetical protein